MANGGDWIYLANGKVTVDNDGGEVILNPGGQAGSGTAVVLGLRTALCF